MTATIFVSWQCAGEATEFARIRDEDSIDGFGAVDEF
jgi:hypothetical protein